MRIVHLIPALETGGAEIVLATLAEALGSALYSHHVVVLSRHQGSEGPVSGRLRAAGARVTGLAGGGSLSRVFALRNLRLLLKAERPQLVHGWMHYGNLAATIGGWGLRGLKHIWAIHQSFSGYSQERLLARLGIRSAAWLSRRPDAIVYVSRAAAAQHEALGFSPAKAVVIQNGIDCHKYSPNSEARSIVRRALGFDENHLVVGVVGRFHPMKDHSTFLQAAASVLRKLPAARFVLVGRGLDRYNRALGEMVNASGLGSSTALLGERHDVERLYNAFDILVSSSWAEAFPLVLCEAMACEVPCVTTDVGDSGLIVGDPERIVPARNPSALASAVLRVLEADATSRRALGKGERRRVTENFGLAAMAMNYSRLYEAILHA